MCTSGRVDSSGSFAHTFISRPSRCMWGWMAMSLIGGCTNREDSISWRGTSAGMVKLNEPTRAKCSRLRRAAAAASLSALGDLELDPPIERIARIVGSGAHEVLAEAHPRRLRARGELRRLRVEALLDVRGALQGETVVVGLRSGPARVAHHVHAHLGHRRLPRDLPQPEAVRPAHLRIEPEVGRPGIEQELHAQVVVAQSERDNLAEGVLCLSRAAELPRGKVNPVEHPQLRASALGRRGLIELEGILIAVAVLRSSRLADRGRRGHALEVDRLPWTTGWRLGA